MNSNTRSNLAALLALFAFSACNAGGSDSPVAQTGASTALPIAPASTPPPTAPARNYTTDALLFVGAGTWSNEVGQLEAILDNNNISYRAIGSAELDSMSVDDLAKYGLLIIPGGSGGTQAGSISSQGHANIRAAVQERGMSYIGFCAGAFVAVAPKPAAGQDVSYGFGVVDGPILDYYYLENQGTSMAMTLASFPDGSKRDIVWYGGPTTPNTGVIAKYPNGDPMMSQMWSGNGFVIISATHPSVLGSTLGLSDSDGVDTALTLQLIQAALHQQPMPSFQ